MIGLDSNVLVRYLTRDDEAQFRAAERAILAAVDADEPLYVCTAVLVETIWVLQQSYGVERSRLAELLQALLDLPSLVIEGEAIVEAALDAYQVGGPDFPDCLIAQANAAAGCRTTLTFDAGAARGAGFALLAAR